MNIELSTEFASRLGWAVIHSLWQGALVVAILASALVLLRRHSAAARHTACVLALAAMVVGFGFTFMRSGSHLAPVGVPPAVPAPPPRSTAIAIPKLEEQREEPRPPLLSLETVRTPDEAAGAVGVTRRPIKAWADRLAVYAPRVGTLWIIGTALLSVWRIGGCWRVRLLRRRGVVAGSSDAQSAVVRIANRLGLRTAVRLLESSRAAVPMLAGFFRPVILLPARLVTGLSPRELEALLAHELAHLARGDVWTNLFLLCGETLFFYQPGVWWITGRARREREHAADDLALRVCEGGVYATALARLAELDSPPAPALAASGGSLLERIRRILGEPVRAESSTGLWAGAVTLFSAALIFSQVLSANAADEGKTIVVAPGESIQQAIDRAPADAVIRLGEGEWRERIVISKPLTLEGAGWEKTRITIEEPSTDEMQKAFAEVELLQKAATTAEEKEKAAAERVRRVARPAILIRGVENAVLRKLRVQGISQRSRESGGTSSELIHFDGTKALVTECAIVGPFGQGIHIGNKSNVEIRASLIAAIWGNGIVVYGRAGSAANEAPGRLHLVESEVRNVYHYGVAIGRGCDSTVVERCRISGTAWHGIRYDDASPTITGNLIFANARCGIYASGATKATVKGNVFWKNEMDGVSCWFANADSIEGNTFVANLREGIGVIGAKPTLTRNIFSNNPIAVVCAITSSRNGGQTPAGNPTLIGNLFWENKVVLQVKDEQKPAPEGSLAADPKFRDLAKHDFTLAPDSPARSANIGAAESLPLPGSWPLLAEEKSIIPADDTREFRFWTAPGAPKESKSVEKTAMEAASAAKDWVADAFQLEDKAKRETAIERIRAAMTSGKVDEARTGVTAFVQIAPIEFDKPSFRPAVRELLKSPDVPTRAKAAQAFALTGADPEDLPRIYALADDSAAEVREPLTGIIAQLKNHDLTDRDASTAILKLMNKLPRDPRSVAHSLWGSKFSPEIEARVLEYCRDLNGAGGDFLYGALSTQANKSEASVKRLIEILAHQDTTNVASRAAWGLRQGVDRAQFPLVADAMVKVIEARSDGYMRREALDSLRAYGDARHAPAVNRLLAKPGVAGEFRKLLEDTLATLEKRPASAEAPPSAATAQPPPTAEDLRALIANMRRSGPVFYKNREPDRRAPAAEKKAEIEVEWRGQWWPATVLEKKDNQARIHYVGYGAEWDEWVPPERIRPLQVALATEDKVRALVEKNRQAARLRAAEDRRHYSAEQLREIETLYQVANTKGKRTEEAKASLKQLLEKYDKANRTGCATLYLGQASEGAERLEYLTRAVEKFSDCYYFNGCQVGGYGRYVLALTLWEKGEKEKARALIAELKTTLKEATDHRGRPITELAEAAEKQFDAQR